jgi:hypothetical protein
MLPGSNSGDHKRSPMWFMAMRRLRLADDLFPVRASQSMTCTPERRMR